MRRAGRDGRYTTAGGPLRKTEENEAALLAANPKTAAIAAPDPSRGKTLVYEMIAPNKERGTI